MTSKPETNIQTNIQTYILRLDLSQFTFDLPKETFESAINLELAIIQKEMREKLIADYDQKNNPDKVES